MNNAKKLEHRTMKIIVDAGLKMRIIQITIGWSAVLVCIAVFAVGCSRNAALITEASGDPALAEILETVRLNARLPALSAAVIRDGNIVARAAVGTRKHGTTNWVSVTDKFMIGSCGKAFTATLAAILIEEGRLGWKTTIKEAFPGLDMLPEYESITLQQLLSHRAGLPKNFIADLDENRSSTIESGRLQFVEQIVQTNLINPPDSVIVYSNAGFTLAGAMMEKITGDTFESLMAKKIFRPLQLNTAGFVYPALSEPESQPWGHIQHYGSTSVIKRDVNHWLNPGGNTLSMSVGDWARFVTRHLVIHQDDGRTLISSASAKKMHTPPNNAKWDYDDRYRGLWLQIVGWPLSSSNYALGWYTVQTREGTEILYHGGATRSFIAVVYASPADKTAILLATNVRTRQSYLYEGAKKIRSHYSLQISLP